MNVLLAYLKPSWIDVISYYFFVSFSLCSKNRISAPGAAMLASVISAGSSSLTSINASANLLSVDSITSIAREIQNSKIYGEPAGKSIRFIS
jgi:hypothetical protein